MTVVTEAFRSMIFIGSITGVYFFSRNKEENEGLEEDNTEQSHLLCRFVTDGLGRKIGESVSIDEDIIIVKSKDRYLGIPLKHVEEDGKTLIVKGLVDLRKSEELGEKWRKESFSEIDQNIEDSEEVKGSKLNGI